MTHPPRSPADRDPERHRIRTGAGGVAAGRDPRFAAGRILESRATTVAALAVMLLAATILRPSVAAPQEQAEGSPDESRRPRGAEGERAAPPRPASGEAAVVPLLPSPPDADDDSATTFKNQPVSFNVLANDTSATGDSLFMDGDPDDPPDGSVDCDLASGDCTYTPDPGFSGSDSFQYSVSDGGLLSSTATVTIDVVNRPPDAVADSAETLQDSPVTIDVLANDTDPDGDAPDVTDVGPPLHGLATLNLDDTITYSPNSGYTGPDGFTYTIGDGDGGTDTGTVAITVRLPNRPPVAVDDADTTAQDTPIQIDVRANDTDPDGDALTISLKVPPPPLNGTVNCTPTGLCTFTPNPGFVGDGSFEYTATDPGGLSDDATVMVTVLAAPPVNHPPDAVNDVTTTQKNTPKNIAVLANDSDPDAGDVLSVTSAGPAGNGTVAVNPNNTITYTPSTGFVGNDSFSYTISDGQGGTDTATVSVTVSDTPPPPNRPPNAINDSASTQRDQAKTINVLANDTDPDGDALTITNVSDPPHGMAVAAGGGNVTYTPEAGFTGGDAFTYTIGDGRGGADNATVSITVTAAPNQPPSAVINSPGGDVTIAPGRTVSFTGTGTDPDGTIVAFTWTFPGGSPSSSAVEDPGNVTFAAPGTFTVTFNVVDNSGVSDPTPAQRTVRVEEGGGGGDPLDVDRSSPGSAGRVDGHDVLFVLRAIESQDPRGDVNGDGRVDRQDVDEVLAALGDSR